MTEQTSNLGSWRNARWVAARLAAIFALLLVLASGVYGLEIIFQSRVTAVGASITMLFILPFCLGAIATFLVDPKGMKADPGYFIIPPLLVASVFIVGALFFREGLVCVAALAPLWLVSALVGSVTVGLLRERFKQRNTINCGVLIVLPFAALLGEGGVSREPAVFTVARSIEIAARPEEIWPHLLKMDDISRREGRWNITQDLLGVPRPASAVVEVGADGPVRKARWGKTISFEEHIFAMQDRRELRWRFAFPNDSIRRHTDRHIAPDGENLKITEGGYDLRALTPEVTKLTLTTTYAVTTPVNHYGSVWGELLLGDIQSNILQIVKDRSEAGA